MMKWNKLFKCILFVVTVALFVYMYKFIDLRIDYLLDCDMSSELVLSNLVKNEGHFIFSNNWYYSTEVRVVYIQIVMAILFRIFSSWHFVRVIGSLLLWVAMCLSVLGLLKSLRVKDYSLLGVIGIMSPVSLTYFYIAISGLSYTPHIILCFIILTLINEYSKKQSKLLLLFISLISILSGSAGYRYLLVLFAPICGASLLIYLYCILLKKETAGLRHKIVIPSFASGACGIIGFLINKFILAKYFDFGFYTTIKPFINGIDKLTTILSGFVNDFGYITTVGSKAKYITLAIALLIIFSYVVSVYKLLKDNRHSLDKKYIALFSLVNIILYIFVNMVTTMHLEDRYTIMCTVFMIPVIIIYIDSLKINEFSKYIIALLMIILLTIPSHYVLDYCRNNNSNGTLKEIVNYVKDLGYENAYATSTYGNMITELSNGEIRTYKFETTYDEKAKDFENLNVWLQRKDNDTDKPVGKVCLFLKYYNSGMDDHIIYWENDDAVVYGFDSYAEMKEIISNLE